MYNRLISLINLLEQKSLLLLGPRQTGKSTLLRSAFPDARYVDLLEADTFRELATKPELLRQRLLPQEKLVIIDEIQKLPTILDEVQLMIDRNRQLRFVLTGSSARKLKRGNANLLGGRAWSAHLYPLVSAELGFGQLERRLQFGSLPGVFTSQNPKEELKAYVGTYLKEEILSEGLTRSIERFSRFLEVAGLSNGEQIDYAAIASDAQLPARTVRDHFQILEDTLVARQLPVFGKTRKRKAIATPKFYFFDVGVANALKRNFEFGPGTVEFGKSFEHLIFCELDAFLSYSRSDAELSYWRTRSQLEVDFVVGESLAVEVKAKSIIRDNDLTALSALGEEFPKMRRVVVCLEKEQRMVKGVEILPFADFLSNLWAKTYVGNF